MCRLLPSGTRLQTRRRSARCASCPAIECLPLPELQAAAGQVEEILNNTHNTHNNTVCMRSLAQLAGLCCLASDSPVRRPAWRFTASLDVGRS